jgi:hypothetical protein
MEYVWRRLRYVGGLKALAACMRSTCGAAVAVAATAGTAAAAVVVVAVIVVVVVATIPDAP